MRRSLWYSAFFQPKSHLNAKTNHRFGISIKNWLGKQIFNADLKTFVFSSFGIITLLRQMHKKRKSSNQCWKSAIPVSCLCWFRICGWFLRMSVNWFEKTWSITEKGAIISKNGFSEQRRGIFKKAKHIYVMRQTVVRMTYQWKV